MFDNTDLTEALQSTGMEHFRVCIAASSTSHSRVHKTFASSPPSRGIRAAIRECEKSYLRILQVRELLSYLAGQVSTPIQTVFGFTQSMLSEIIQRKPCQRHFVVNIVSGWLGLEMVTNNYEQYNCIVYIRRDCTAHSLAVTCSYNYQSPVYSTQTNRLSVHLQFLFSFYVHRYHSP